MYKRILLAVDDDAASDAVALEAERMARTGGARIKVLHVAQEPIDTMSYAASSRSIGARVAAGERLLARIGERLRSEMLEVVGGNTTQPILETALLWKADLIVMGTHGRRGIPRLAMGSDAEDVLRASPVPVLLTRQDEEFISLVADSSKLQPLELQ